MKCNSCNTDVQEDAKFCPSCGAVITPEGTNMNTEEVQPEAAQQQQNTYDQQQFNNQQYNQQANPYNQQNTYYGQQQGPQINGTTYLVLSILATLLCCLPLGIASIVFSTKINSLQNAGDYTGAQEAAKKTKLFLILSVVLGIIGSAFVFFFTIMGSSSYYYY